MSTTLPPEARRLREDLSQLTDLAANDLGVVWRDIETPDQAKVALNDILPKLVSVYGSAAGALAADWYDDLRDERGIARRFSAVVAEPTARVGVEELVGHGVGPLYQREPDFAAARSLTEGGMQRRIANVSRQTVMASATQDPSAAGWQRVGVGACKQGFCDMLIARGAVYTRDTVRFAAHDHCQCGAQPAWGGEPVPVKPFEPSLKQATDADKERLREYLRTGESAVKTTPQGVRTVPGSGVDVDAARTTAQLRETAEALEKSANKFESPGTRARIDDLRRKIAERGD